MKKSTRILCTGTLTTAVIAALSAFAATADRGVPPATTGVRASAGTAAGAAPAGRKVMPAPLAKQASFDRFIVKYRSGAVAARSPDALLAAVNAAATRAGVAGLALQPDGSRAVLGVQHVRRLGVGADLVRLSRKLGPTEADALLAQLRADPSVEYAQPDYIKQPLDFAPNDPLYGAQWHYRDSATGIRAPAAWDVATGEGVVVAVLDTGYLDHADLDANVVPGYDFIADAAVANDGDGRDADAHDPGDWRGSSPSSFHGTHVAGTVAAVTDNALGVAGVAFNAKVQPVRVLGTGGGYTSDIADAIVWASGGSVDGVPDNATPAEVINMSLGGYGPCSSDAVTQNAIDSAVGRGTIVVVAAGNDGDDASYYSPASCRNVITVGASGVDGARSYYSNFGPYVAISAPGGNATSVSDPDDRWIWSLGNAGTQAPVASPEGDRYVGMIGTSMASPHVAGVVALMQSAAVAAGKPALTSAQVKSILRATATPWTVAPPPGQAQGPGIVDAAAAVHAATQDIPADPGSPIDNRMPQPGLAGAPGDALLFRVVVPAGKTSLNLRTYGGSGDVSLYTAFERTPTTADYDRKSAKPGNSEAVVIRAPAAGTYYLLVVGETAFADVSVLAVY
ncbi:S8 family peptidase [Vulcaniibacterium tengchongense]|uniref:Serine protease n=1 Tax=Vulcaniibacterium tengchongense TaxID=1273429 RepID=A0A3N4VEA7_9GAMM|nr:S8 family peptidase [Vulcaniibacterium tengchongense]RPE80978.1 serine protease [Vulcaniibacterium tengchongense]